MSILSLYNVTPPANYNQTFVVQTEGNLKSKQVIIFTTPERNDFKGAAETPWKPCFNAILQTFKAMQSDQKERSIAIPCLEAEYFPKDKEEEEHIAVASFAVIAATEFVQTNPGTKVIFTGEGNPRIAAIYEMICSGVKDVSVDTKAQAATADTTAIALPKKTGKVYPATSSAVALALKTAEAAAAAKAEAARKQAEQDLVAKKIVDNANFQAEAALKQVHFHANTHAGIQGQIDKFVKQGDIESAKALHRNADQCAALAEAEAQKAIEASNTAMKTSDNASVASLRGRVAEIALAAQTVAGTARKYANMAKAGIADAEKTVRDRIAEEQALKQIQAENAEMEKQIKLAEKQLTIVQKAQHHAERAAKEGSVQQAVWAYKMANLAIAKAQNASQSVLYPRYSDHDSQAIKKAKQQTDQLFQKNQSLKNVYLTASERIRNTYLDVVKAHPEHAHDGSCLPERWAGAETLWGPLNMFSSLYKEKANHLSFIDKNLRKPAHYVDTPDQRTKQARALENATSILDDEELENDIALRYQASTANAVREVREVREDNGEGALALPKHVLKLVDEYIPNS